MKHSIGFQSVRASLLALTVVVSSSALAAGGGLPDWGYEGELGPVNWAGLSTDGVHFPYATCGSGQEQSPVDISHTQRRPHLNILRTAYTSVPLNVENNGHTIQANYAPGSRLRIGRDTYYLLQFHFHAHSEHTVNGASSPVEIHFVHMNSNGELAVLGVLVNEAADAAPNPAIEKLLELAPHTKGKAAVSGKAFDAGELLPSLRIKRFFHYAGSLTTPPCSEGVKWFVARETIALPPGQIAALDALLHGNYRPVQPIHERTILRRKP